MLKNLAFCVKLLQFNSISRTTSQPIYFFLFFCLILSMPLFSLTLFFILSLSLFKFKYQTDQPFLPSSPSSSSPFFLALSLHLLNRRRPLSSLSSSFLSTVSPQISATLSLCLLRLAPTSLFNLSFASASSLLSTFSLLPDQLHCPPLQCQGFFRQLGHIRNSGLVFFLVVQWVQWIYNDFGEFCSAFHVILVGW